ncbi:MAG TPA: efflux RND transporter periplasmic adaptor subunit [Pirellulales bacterium]|nr:efflux RND transporter periplasmic adaptor subunit [Pirellulales bacterium]
MHRAAIHWCCLALISAMASGCSKEEKIDYTSVSGPQKVQVIRARIRKIVRVVGQPSFVEAYERSSIYPKMSGYLEKWVVDIGDPVKKGDVMATLFVPEVIEDFETKKATVALDRERVALALTVVEVATADLKAAKARLIEAKEILGAYEAQVKRWAIQVDRLAREVKRKVVDPQVLLESQNQLEASRAERNKAIATVAKAEAELASAEATLAKAKVDVNVARADLLVAESEANRLEAWTEYLTIPAPFDGLVVARNANTYDFVLPRTGDPTAMQRAPYLSPSTVAAPIYVVDRTDVVRIFVDVPEQDADWVHAGSKAMVLIRGYRDEELPAKVTRTAWALNVTSRTLRAEIDLPNPNGEIRPGMYAYGYVVIERPAVRALPRDAIDYKEEQTVCWMYKNGKAQRTEIATGVGDEEWIEVKRHRTIASKAKSGWGALETHEPASPDQGQEPSSSTTWMRFDGTEQIIVGDLDNLTDGDPVQIEKENDDTQVATAY